MMFVEATGCKGHDKKAVKRTTSYRKYMKEKEKRNEYLGENNIGTKGTSSTEE